MGLPAIKSNREIFKGMPDKEYRAIPALSQSDLSWFKYSPRHYLKRAELRKETAAMSFGSAFHLALLEPAKFKESWTLEPDKFTLDGKTVEINKRVKAHREYLESWRIDNADKTILTEKDADNLTGMLKNISDDPELVGLIELGSPECVVTWDYRGRKCKAKADLWVPDSKYGPLVIDFKKTQDASEVGFSRSIYNFSYSLQAAWYLEGFQASRFFFVAVEDKPPYAIGKWDAEHYLELGTKQMNTYLETLEKCEKTGVWPSYSQSFDSIRPPNWMAAIEDEKE